MADYLCLIRSLLGNQTIATNLWRVLVLGPSEDFCNSGLYEITSKKSGCASSVTLTFQLGAFVDGQLGNGLAQLSPFSLPLFHLNSK